MKKYIISKRRYIGPIQNDFDSYVLLDGFHFAWTDSKDRATRFDNQRQAADFLNKNNIEGATIEPLC